MAAKKKVKSKNKLSAKKIINSAKSRLGGEEFKVEGKKVVSKVKELIKQGNVRKITIKDSKGGVVMSIPVNVGIIGAVLVPPLIVLGALVAMLSSCTITVQRK